MREDPLFQIIPGYREAVERETLDREAAFLPVTESIAGVEVLPLTPLHYSMLECAGSPFVRGGLPNPGDVLAFLWCVSPRYCSGYWRRWLFARSLRRLSFVRAVQGIGEYLTAAFADAPGVKQTGFKPSYYSGTAALVDLLASQYGWTEETILRIPFKRLFQYARAIRARHDDKPIFFNPSDSVISEWQERDELNRRKLQEQAKQN
jgi:hypothetical protein